MKILLEMFIVTVVVLTALFVYQYQGDEIKSWFSYENQSYLVYVGEVALTLSVADDDRERKQGLSGVASLGNLEGKLFVFDSAAKHGIWMKDMLFSIDIIWLDEKLEVIYIEENVAPNTYPEVFAPESPARFVIETNAYLARSLKMEVGDRVSLPSEVLPSDIKKKLQN